MAPGYDPGEDGQFRTVRAKAIKFSGAVEGYVQQPTAEFLGFGATFACHDDSIKCLYF